MSESNLVQLLVRCTRDERKAFRKMALELDTTVQEMVRCLCRDAHAAWMARQAAAKKQPATVRSVEPKGTTRGGAGLVGTKIHPPRPKSQPRSKAVESQCETAPYSVREPLSMLWPGQRRPEKIGETWYVVGADESSVGPFDSNDKAWKWLDRRSNEVTSPAEKRTDYRWSERT